MEEDDDDDDDDDDDFCVSQSDALIIRPIDRNFRILCNRPWRISHFLMQVDSS